MTQPSTLMAGSPGNRSPSQAACGSIKLSLIRMREVSKGFRSGVVLQPLRELQRS